MPSAKYFQFAERLPAYGGVVAHRLAELHQAGHEEAPPAAPHRGGSRPAASEPQPLPISPSQANAHEAFAASGRYPPTFRQIKRPRRKREEVKDGVQDR